MEDQLNKNVGRTSMTSIIKVFRGVNIKLRSPVKVYTSVCSTARNYQCVLVDSRERERDTGEGFRKLEL